MSQLSSTGRPSTRRFDGRVALITGAARGLGRSHAIRLASEGADIGIVELPNDDLNAEVGYAVSGQTELDETVATLRSLGSRVVVCQGDVRSQDDLDSAVAETVKAFGRLDIVVANAGVGISGTAASTSEAQWRMAIDINLTGVWHTVKAAVPTMVRQQYGRLVLVSSVGGVKPVAGMAAYCAGKAGVIALTKCLALELAEEGITANAVAPATVLTGLNRHLEAKAAEWTAAQVIPKAIDPADVSAAVAYLASEEARYVTGSVALVDAGFAVK